MDPSAPFFLPAADPRNDAALETADSAEPPARKSAWNRPSNGTADAAVIDATAWPPLSESARASPKSSSSESLKSLPELTAPHSIAEQAPPSPTPQPKPVATNPVGHVPTRQRSMKRGNANGPVANGGQAPVHQSPSASGANQNQKQVLALDIPWKNGGAWEHGNKAGGFSPQGHGGRNEYYRSSSGNSRKGGGNGGGHHNGGNPRQDQDRRGYEWNPYPNFAGKNMAMSPHQRPMHRAAFFQAPFHVPQPPYIVPASPVRPFSPSVVYSTDVAAPMMYGPPPPMHHDHLRPAMSYLPPHMFYLPPDPHLTSALLKQIDYYFSNENLCKDVFLRQNMDDEGWVPVAVIANFNRVRKLTDNHFYILETVRGSSVVEVQGDKIRRRNDWSSWILRPQADPAANLQSPDSPAIDNLANQVRDMGLGEVTIGQSSMVSVRSPGGQSSGEYDSVPNQRK